jgi:hypothetical protein
MINTDDSKRLFLRDAAIAAEVDRQESAPSSGAPSLLARTRIQYAYPTTAQCYYACEPLTLLGPEVEGAPGVITELGATFLALNLGNSAPPVGTRIVATFVGNRWVFRYDA